MLNINNLVIEVTRKCNMECAHCLRGNPQNKTMCDEHMYNFLSQVEYISSVTFTGGEPTLPSGMKVIERFMEICNDFGVEVGSFYIATNGKVWRSKFPELINRLHDFCSDNEISGIDISGDRFHETDSVQIQDFRYRLEEELEWKYGLDQMVNVKPDIDYKYVISEGRGKYINDKELDIDYIVILSQNNIQEGTFYLNCDGDVINGCDWSYKSQKEREDILICKAKDDIEKSLDKYEFIEYDNE